MIALAEIREKLLAERKVVEVAEWGLVGDKALRIGSILARDYYQMREKAKAEGGLPEADDDPKAFTYFVELIAACAYDADGAKAFGDEEGLTFLRESELRPILRLANACLEVNGLGETKGG